MSFAGIPFGHGTFGGVPYTVPVSSPPVGGEPEVPIIIDPFTVEISGMSMKGHQLLNSLSIDFELGRQGSAQFSLKNIPFSPEIGSPVRILYYNEVLFVGAVDRVKMASNNMQSFVRYDFECTDNSYLLFRKKLTFTLNNLSVSSIANSVIGFALQGDGITLGTVDNNVNVPSASANSTSVFEFLNGVAVSTGTVFFIDQDKRLNFIGASQIRSPQTLNGNIVQDCSVELDRETYRNKQTTTVTGTPQVENQAAVSVTVERINQEQQAARVAIEGGGGVYSDIAQITHPMSNSTIDLIKLANAYNKISLALAGSIRRSVSITTRQVGFNVGEVATVDIPQVGVSGDWIIRRASLREESGRFLISSLQLNQTSLMRRAQELWIELVRKGTVAILPPSAVYTNISINTTPGIGSFQVPVGVTDVQITVLGGGGGGGGGAKNVYLNQTRTANGANGGSGGLAILVTQVTPGEVLTFWVGAGGAAGAGQYRVNSSLDSIGATGGNGIESYAQRSGGYIVRAFGGQGGLGGLANAYRNLSISYPAGASGGGIGGNAVTVGGAGNGGYGGIGAVSGASAGDGTIGTGGRVIFEW